MTDTPYRFEHELCVLTLPVDFRRVPNLDEGQASFESAERKASIVLSILPVDIPVEGLLGFATLFLEVRKAAEIAARPNAHIPHEVRELTADGMVAHVGYVGSDDDGMFRFLGWAHDHKFVSLWIGTEGKDNDHSVRIMNEAFQGLRI